MEKINVIIVDDHKTLRDAFSILFKKYNIHIIGEAENGRQVLKLLEKKYPDILLLDLQMPQMNGNETLEIIREKFPDLSIVILSQYDELGLAYNYMQRGAKAYLRKGLNLLSVVKGIQDVYAGKNLFEEFSNSNNNFYYTNREIDIVKKLVEGKTNKTIAAELFVSEKTVEGHRERLYRKTNSRSANDFFKYVYKHGLEYLGYYKTGSQAHKKENNY